MTLASANNNSSENTKPGTVKPISTLNKPTAEAAEKKENKSEGLMLPPQTIPDKKATENEQYLSYSPSIIIFVERGGH